MSDWIAGLLAIFVGAVFCYQGFLAMRIVIAVWGALVGFALGAGIGADDGGFLANTLSWVLGIVLALAFAAIAYLYYEVSIAIAMGSIGFTLGASLLVALGVTWSWVIVLAGLSLGVVLAIVAIAGDLPTILLVLLSAAAGASAIVTGIMLLTGTIDTDQITRSAELTEELNDDWYWYAIWIAAAATGVVTQLANAGRMRATMRESWSAPGTPTT
jgi:predicted outer membrane lipoprotein